MDGEAETEDQVEKAATELFVVGIGASAGGLEAISELLKYAPLDVPAAYVVAQHMSPKHKSLLTSLIDRETHLKVREIEDGMVMQPNTAYITPPRNDVVVEGARVRLMPPSEKAGTPKPSVDRLFESIAKDHGTNAVGIVLSGTGSDGAHGIAAIREAGGTTFAQHADSAKYDGMPLAALRTGFVDLIMTPEDLGAHLAKLPETLKMEQPMLSGAHATSAIDELFALLSRRTHVDFRGYKMTTIERRIHRRMAINNLTSLIDYVGLCRNKPEEVDALYSDFLVSVTRFFRDKSEFAALRAHIEQLVRMAGDRQIRVWVAGCATGEEAYSIAILFAEAMGGLAYLDKSRLMIFATDLDEAALSVARTGRYPSTASADIDVPLLDRYFRIEGEELAVRRSLRDLIVFSRHNVFEDPAFLRIDLICCRNLLIYFDNHLQDRTLARFHTALESSALLFLGLAESVSVSKDLFGRTDPALNLFRKRQVAGPGKSVRLSAHPKLTPIRSVAAASADRQDAATSNDEMFVALAKGIGPAVMLFDERHRILRVFGEVNRFLTLAEANTPELNSSLLMEPFGSEAQVLVTTAIRTRRRQTGNMRKFDQFPGESFQLEAVPILDDRSHDRTVLLSINRFVTGDDDSSETQDEPNIAELKRELEATSAALIQTIEDLSSTNEELHTTTEEMQATNEELLALIEELETSNEELQSTNEELVTINEELTITSHALATLSEEQDAMLANIGVPVLVIDTLRRIAKASKAAESLFDVVVLSESPHVSQCAMPPGFPALVDVVEQTFSLGTDVEREITSKDRTYALRSYPIFSDKSKISGVNVVIVETPNT
ncbi:MAG: chemotaxis protein CheB [Paracoccaceae bacterium]